MFTRAAVRTAEFFGFQDLSLLRAAASAQTCPERQTHTACARDRRADALYGLLASGACSYFDYHLYRLGEPACFYALGNVPRTGEPTIALQIIGVEKSIAEALLIEAFRMLFNEIGAAEPAVRINSLGDQESSSRYLREVGHFLKRRAGDLPPSAREQVKDDLLLALTTLAEHDPELASRSPNPLEYLSDQSRKHFREVVEFLDMSGMPYEIDPHLLGHPDCYGEALFALEGALGSDAAEVRLSARGGRYSTFVRRMSQTPVAAVGAVAVLNGAKGRPAAKTTGRKAEPAPIFMVQLGFGPRLRSLLLLRELRQAGVVVAQDIVNDSLTSQLRKAETSGSRYAVIIGQKEFVESKAIVRDLHEQNQEQVPFGKLPGHLRRLAKVAC
jgi:histidyl-tRNA synthetase